MKKVFDALEQHIQRTNNPGELEVLIEKLDSCRDSAWKKYHAAKQQAKGVLQQRESLKALYKALVMQGLEDEAISSLRAAAAALGKTDDYASALIAEAQSEKTSVSSSRSSSSEQKFRLEIGGVVVGEGYRGNMELARRLAAEGLVSGPKAQHIKQETPIDATKMARNESVSWKNVVVTRIV